MVTVGPHRANWFLVGCQAKLTCLMGQSLVGITLALAVLGVQFPTMCLVVVPV